MMETIVGSPRLRTVRLLLYIESDATAICFLRSGEEVGAREMFGLDDTLEVDRGRLGAIIHVQR